MIRGYYLFAPVEAGCVGLDSGIERKVRSQYKALSMYCECELVILPYEEPRQTIWGRIYRRLPNTAAWREWKYKGEFNDATFIYIRKVYEDNSFIRYLKAIKKANPKVKVIYEVPTYPENQTGINTLSTLPYRLKTNHAQEKLRLYVDKIVTYYGQEKIYGIPCINTINGYDFSRIELPQRRKNERIEILSVAVNASWHGYERLIKGIKNYYAEGGKENIVYHVVGTPLTEYGQTDEHVILHGPMHGEALQALYQQCLLGVDVLGGHRKDYPVSSSLKSREYAAHGLPLITSSPIDYLEKDSRFQLVLPYDDSPIDMNQVVEYYHNLYDDADCNALAYEIRKNGEEKCSMLETMKPVVDWLKASV